MAQAIDPRRQAILDQLGQPDESGGGGAAAPIPGPTLPYTAPDPNADLSGGILENHTSHLGALSGAASGASTGASIGSVVPVLGTLAGAGIGAGVGALAGWAKARTNDTKNEREQFAQQLGVPDTTALWQKLGSSVTPEAAQELQNRALNRIGKHDETANAQWIQDVRAALEAGLPAPAATTTTAATPAATTAPDPAAATSGLGAFAGKLAGFDQAKFADPNRSEKYKIGEVMSRFDPRQGVTPEMLSALNALGIADFSGQGDQLSVKNTKHDPRFGTGGTADVVKGLKGNNDDTMWAPWFVGDQNPVARPTAASGGSAGGNLGAMDGLNALLAGDPSARIQAELQALINGNQSPAVRRQMLGMMG